MERLTAIQVEMWNQNELRYETLRKFEDEFVEFTFEPLLTVENDVWTRFEVTRITRIMDVVLVFVKRKEKVE